MLTRRQILAGSVVTAVLGPRLVQAELQPVYRPAEHWLNSPQWCMRWWLALPHNHSTVWRDLLRQSSCTWTSVAATASATSGVSQATRRRGGFGEARCDGTNDHGLIADADELSPTVGGGTDGPFSVTCWLKLTAIATTQGLLSKWTNDGSSAEWLIFTDSSTLYWVSYAVAADGSVGRGMSLSAGTHQGIWMHLACTYTGSETDNGFKIYLNGVRTDSINAGFGSYTGNTNTAQTVRIASYNAGNYCAGAFDDVRIYRRELAQAEVRLLWYDSLLGYPSLLTTQSLVGQSIVAAPTRRKAIVW